MSSTWNLAAMRGSLFAFMCFALAALCVTFGYVAYQARQDAGRDLSVEAENLVSAVAHDVDQNLEMLDVTLQSIAQGWSDADIHALAPGLRQRVLFDHLASTRATDSLAVADENGVVMTASDLAHARIRSVEDRDYFLVHRANTDIGLFVSKPIVSRATGAWVVALSRRINKQDGSFGGAAIAIVSLSYLDSLYGALDLGSDGKITLFRTEGTVLFRKPFVKSDIARNVRTDGGFGRVSNARSGSFEGASPIDGVDRLVSFHRIGKLPLIQVVELSTEKVYADWWRKTMIVGSLLGLLCLSSLSLLLLLYAELARRVEAEAAMGRLATTDGLTGLANRRRFDECLDLEWTRAMRARSRLCLLMIDADHFKGYNDAYGHLKGDDLLQLLARTMAASVHRPGDHVARYGGEEFAIMLPDTDLAGALVVAETVREAVAGLQEQHPAASMPVVTVSIGVTCLIPRSNQPSQELVRAADDALYLAKADGRNCVRAASLGRRELAIAS